MSETATKLGFSPEVLTEIEQLVARYPRRIAAILPVLRIAEREFTNLGDEAMELVARTVGVSPAYVLGIVTFYTHFRRAGCGAHRFMVCSTLSCALAGSERLFDHLREKLGLDAGETTPDGLFTLEKVECLASCGTAPVVQVGDDYHECATTQALDQLIAKLRAREKD